ncbi:hypothetical protein QR680_015073 [Steinernema hermaphroditum]|uniref:PDZ domain-containing protein n=1 Tax=Steinernema hermaphroditum TaxID=289476 RepID=A0AA39M5C4_9BILA|nr:hypothetical protein QR680_015073 [Steinernema hermaphroditum]
MAIYSPKVTVHFGPVRVVVSTTPSMRVGDLASIAHLRYCKAVRKHPSTVRIRRLVAFKGSVVLDPFDYVEDVYDHGFGDQILAIFDEPTPHQLTPTSSSSASSPSSSAHVVEVTSLTAPPPGGLRVESPLKKTSIPNMSSSSSSSSSQRRYVRNQNGRKSTDSGIPTRSVTLSPEIEKKELKSDTESMIKRSDARKSRISEALFDKLEEMAISTPSPSIKPKSNLSGLIQSTANPSHTVVVLNKYGTSKEIGIEISGVPHPNYTDRLEAVEVLRIDPEGRVAEDGRIKAGDRLVEINERPVYQMSLARARAYLHELAGHTAPTVTVDRSIESFDTLDKPAAEMKPIVSALQQANTKQIGNTSIVSIVKGATGLGFTVRNRETSGADGHLERLFYVGSLVKDGPAHGVLRPADRILEVDGKEIANKTQSDVVAMLKAVPKGEAITLLISRIGSSVDESTPSGSTTPALPHKPPPTPSTLAEASSKPEGQLLELEIPFNDTGSAGLGISLKARAMFNDDGSRRDCGIYVKHVITGGAAFRDGRLQVHDQIIGIEDVDLLKFERNADANQAIAKCLKNLDPNVKSVRLRVRRWPPNKKAVTPNGSTVGVIDTTVGSAATVSTPLQSPQKDPLFASRQNSAFDDAASEVSSVVGDRDHFARDNVTRRSVSEKRHLGAANDPSHLQIFQKIKHQRQASAPPGPLQTSASFTGGLSAAASGGNDPLSNNRRYSRSFNSSASRQRQSSLGPLKATPEMEIDKPVVESADIPDEEPKGSMRRRSASAESVSVKRSQESAVVHEIVGNGHAQFVKHREPSKEPPGTMARKMAKEKQQRRKSIGSTIFSKKWFSLGSKSRDASPEKQMPAARHLEEYKRIQTASPSAKRYTVNIDHHRIPSSEYYRNQKKLECATSPGRRVVANSVFYSERSSREELARHLRHTSQIFPHHPQGMGSADTPLASRTITVRHQRPTSIFTMEPPTIPARSPASPHQSSSALVDSSFPEVRLRPLRTSTPLLESPRRWPPPAPTTTTPSTPGSRIADASPGLRLVTNATDPVPRPTTTHSSPLRQDNASPATEHRRSRPLDEHSTIQYRRPLLPDPLRPPPPPLLHTPTEAPPPLPSASPATSSATALPFISAVSNANPRMSLRARKQRAAIRVFDVDKNEKPPILLRARSDARPISPSDIDVVADLDKPHVPLRREAFRFSNRRESESRSRSTHERLASRSHRRPTSEVLVFNENESPPAYC